MQIKNLVGGSTMGADKHNAQEQYISTELLKNQGIGNCKMKYQVLIESERVEPHLPNAPRICMECPNLLYVILPLL